ncbi:MAG: alpha/beta fold hydrolase [Candidatus Thermoplasmatota archaeon]
MREWTAWSDAKALSFLHARVRQLLVSQGVEDSFVQVDGHPVHVYAAGPTDAHRTVVLLHGLGDTANNWFRTLPLLAWRGDRVLAIDLPGHGWSPPHDDRGFLSIREHASVVREVVKAKSPGNDIGLVGHSLGGWVATRAHLDGLDASRLVLVESAGLAYEGMWDSLEMLRIEHETDVRRFFKIVMHKPPAALNIVAREVASMFRSPAVVNFINSTHRADIINDKELSKVRAKTTILWGESDGLIPPIMAHRWHMGVPGSRLVWIPKCGHAPQFERPILFQNLIEEALGHPPFGTELRTRILARIPPGVRSRIPWSV